MSHEHSQSEEATKDEYIKRFREVVANLINAIEWGYHTEADIIRGKKLLEETDSSCQNQF